MAMLRSAKELWRIYSKGKASSKTAKRINGVLCRLAWAGSASELASQEAKLAIMDEIDRMAFDVSGEGSPIELVDARLATYPGSKLVLTSTPTEGNVVEEAHPDTGLVHWSVSEPDEVKSTVWRLWQEGTRFEWSWPCPDCGEYFIPRFSLLKWPDGITPSQARRQARIICPNCGVGSEDRFKTAMNRNGRFVAPGQTVDADGVVSGDIEPNEHYSYWISGLASPWKTWGQRAAEFLTVARSGDQGRVQGVVNTSFGELFRTGGSAPPWQDIRELGAGYAYGEHPEGPLVVTCGVDVQKDRLIYAVRGWSYNLESWLLEFGELYGPTEEDAVWLSLAAIFDRPFCDGLHVRVMAIDSGYRPGDKYKRPDHMVYKFCRQFPGKAMPTKGRDEQQKPLIPSQIDVRVDGKILKKSLQLWHIDSDYMKSWVHGRLRMPIDQPGAWHLPVDISDDYCMQITAEAKAIKPSGKTVWIRIRKENHLLDCEALNVAAAHMLSLQTLRPRPVVIKDPGVTAAPESPQQPVAQIQPQRPAQVQQRPMQMSSSWINNWRR